MKHADERHAFRHPTDWSTVRATHHPGETGQTTGAPGSSAPYACAWSNIHPAIWRITGAKGHILLCLEGELVTELKDGRVATLRPGMSYGGGWCRNRIARAHRDRGKLFIVD